MKKITIILLIFITVLVIIFFLYKKYSKPKLIIKPSIGSLDIIFGENNFTFSKLDDYVFYYPSDKIKKMVIAGTPISYSYYFIRIVNDEENDNVAIVTVFKEQGGLTSIEEKYTVSYK